MSHSGKLLPIETITLLDARASSRAVIAPSRGGMLTRFDVDGRPVFFMDDATLADAAKNVRGGNPVLFPSPGRLAEDRFTWRGTSGAMKQHGIARQKPWSVVSSSEREATLELTSDDETRAAFPWDFTLRVQYVLDRAKVAVETTVTNRSKEPMPFALGFHPYIHVPAASKAKVTLETEASRAFDNVAKAVVDVKEPLDFTKPEVDLLLVDHGSDQATLDLGDGHRVVVSAEPAFRRWVLWTLEGKDFICVEPWTAAADALNRDEGVLVVDGGKSRTLIMTMAFEG